MTVYSTSELTLRYVTVNLLLGSVYIHTQSEIGANSGSRNESHVEVEWANELQSSRIVNCSVAVKPAARNIYGNIRQTRA